VSLPSSYRSRRGHIHLLRVLPLVGCRSKTPTVAAAAVTERDSLASRLALTEAEIEKLRAVAASAEETAERAKTAAATAETTAREAFQTATCEKAALEAKVLELESDLRTATTDLVMTSRQFSRATNQL
jgi:hypothetical protein